MCFDDEQTHAYFLEAEDEEASPKHVYLNEVRDLIKSGASLIVYHHLGRHGGTHDNQIRLIREALMRDVGNDCEVLQAVRFRRGSGRAYFILANTGDHRRILQNRLHELSHSSWAGNHHMTFPECLFRL